MNLKLAEKIDAVKELSIEELCEKFDCSAEEICVGDYIARNTDDTVCPYKVILGFANFENSKVTDLGKLEIVYGKKLVDDIGPLTDMSGVPIYLGINLKDSFVRNLGNLRMVYGSIDLNTQITNLKNVEFLGSNLFLSKTNLVHLGNLQVIDGILDIEKSHLLSFGKLRKVRILNIGSKMVSDFEEIEEVKKFIINTVTNQSTNKLISKEFKLEGDKYIRSHVNIKSQDV